MDNEVPLWDGTMSAHEFHSSAHAFSVRWKRSNPKLPPWTWVSSTSQNLGYPLFHSHQINGFLALEKLCPSELNLEEIPSWENLRAVPQADKEEASLSEENEPIDNAMLESSNGVGIHYYDFHIVYSASFRVPVLFFRAYRIDGQTMSLDEIEKDLPSSSTKILMESKWTFITQEEHPHLNRPWYKLHPCGTSEWMKLLFQSNSCVANKGVVPKQELYLVSWLSVVGQVVGLRIPLEMINCLD